ncbi:ABC transporter permease [Chryseolinea lacunae]|uniref:ABC transporter permease n=1 Tax=Chryseolinea lacunae TaxID=2801331 RepID=A0ABS1KXN6_9BACT|nr:ABC transporter permease [Chryseolinea lacunae]MBL0744221.1 ABC transporter permease [Chryseolinea lacunae]
MANMPNSAPPRLVLRFLQFVCPPQLLEEIEGDLVQRFAKDVTLLGARRARLRFAWNVIRYVRPSILFRRHASTVRRRNLMLANTIKLTGRQWIRNKTFSTVNVLGLTLGLAVCLLVAQFVLFEKSFDRYSPHADRTYRVNLYNTENGVFDKISPATVSGLGYELRNQLAAVEDVARVGSKTGGVVANPLKGREDLENQIVYADASVAHVLGLTFVNGQSPKTFADTHSIFISTALAEKYFDRRDVTGEMLAIGFNNGSALPEDYHVAGVFEDMPPNTHLRFDMILPPPNEQAWNENWSWGDVSTYVLLQPEANATALAPAFAEMVKQHHHSNTGDRYLLEPIASIRLQALDGSGRGGLINFFMVLAAIVLLLAWFNFVNLSTARFFERLKEVGVRKLIGAGRFQLMMQFLVEAFIFNLVSGGLALMLFVLCWPSLAAYFGQPATITLWQDGNILYGVGFVLVGTLCTGFYPALFLSSFTPLLSLQGKIGSFADRTVLRKVLVAVQLSVSVALLTGVMAVRQQVDFMRSQNLGIALDQTLIVESPLLTDNTTANHYEPFRQALLKMPGVEHVTYASSFAGEEIDWHRTDITLGAADAGYRYGSRIVGIGTEFLEAFDLPLLAGRNFDATNPRDTKTMLISEAALKMFGFETPAQALGQNVFVGSRQFEVIGVVRNYHFRALQTAIQPLLYIQGYPRNPRYAIKLSGGNMQATVAAIGSVWKTTYAGNVFKYYFLDDFFDRQYAADQQVGTLVTALSLLAAFISCIGLFGLTLYAVHRRTKEIGIRKVMGATVSQVMMLLSREFMMLAGVGMILPLPFLYYAVNQWLTRYAYRITPGPVLFILPLAAILLLAFITMSFQTVVAARRNPVDSMKHE